MAKRWHIQTLYFYLVSFVALILIITGSIRLTRTAITCLTPLPEGQLTTNDHTVSIPMKRDTPYLNEPQSVKLWEEKFGLALVQRENERYEVIARENNRRSLIRELIAGMAYVAAALPVFLYHWRKIPQLEEG